MRMVSCWGKLINEGGLRNVINIASSTILNFHSFGLAWCCCVSVLLILWWLYVFSIKWLHYVSNYLFHNSVNLRVFFFIFVPCSSYQELLHKPELGSSWSHPSDYVPHEAAQVEGFPLSPNSRWGCAAAWPVLMESLPWFSTAVSDPLLCCRSANILLGIISLLLLRKQQWFLTMQMKIISIMIVLSAFEKLHLIFLKL